MSDTGWGDGYVVGGMPDAITGIFAPREVDR